MAERMKVYTVRDYVGSTSTHLVLNFDSAVQAHMIYHGLLHIAGEITQVRVVELQDVEDRNTVCW